MDEILKNAATQGLGYALFVWLLFYILKEQKIRDGKSEARESKYQEIIMELTNKFSTISADVKDIKEDLKEHLKNHD